MIQRTLEAGLKQHLTAREMSLIVGPRQAGKTTLMRSVQTELQKAGERTLWFSLDRMADEQFFVSQESLVRKMEQEVGSRRSFVFIDEIQRREDAGRFLKGLYDMDLPYKFILSGSGSVELKERIHESMAGRKRIFELTTVTLQEFLNWKTDGRYREDIMAWAAGDALRADPLIEEYLKFGGYPSVVVAAAADDKRIVIEEIYQSYLARDVSQLLHVNKPRVFTHLVQLMASQTGQLANVAELARTLGVAEATIRDYLWYLEKTYIIDKVTPHHRNARKELTKAAVYYFTDIGLANFSQGTFGEAVVGGWRWQNLIGLQLQEQVRASNRNQHVHFWRTTGGAEVDYVVEQGSAVLPIEVKDSALQRPMVSRSLRSFIEAYRPTTALVVNRSLRAQRKVGETTVRFATLTDPNLFEVAKGIT